MCVHMLTSVLAFPPNSELTEEAAHWKERIMACIIVQ